MCPIINLDLKWLQKLYFFLTGLDGLYFYLVMVLILLSQVAPGQPNGECEAGRWHKHYPLSTRDEPQSLPPTTGQNLYNCSVIQRKRKESKSN